MPATSDAVRRVVPTALLLLAIFAVALTVRCLNWQDVFQGGEIHFQDGDSWFHMRTVHNLLHHFPHRSAFDPYSGFPNGQAVTTGPVFDFAIATTAWLAGFGRPSAHLIDLVGAWFPAVLGALVTIPVYFLARFLFSPAAGWFAAAFTATLPGTILSVSKLGLADHHIAEVLLATLVFLFLCLALEGDRPRLFTLLAGVALGCFLATRAAGAFLVVIVCCWAVLECAAEHWQGKNPRKTALVVLATLAVGWILFLPSNGLMWSDFTLLALGGGAAAVTFSAGTSHWLARRQAPKWAHAAVLGAAVAVVGGAVLMLRPHSVTSLAGTALRYATPGPTLSVRELRPLLFMNGGFSLSPVWSQFGVSWIFGLVTLGLLAWELRRNYRPALSLLLTWTAVMFVAALLQNRMASFLAVDIAILVGYFCARVWRSGSAGLRPLLAVALVLLVSAPNVPYALAEMRNPGQETAGWQAALEWLRSSTPEPFGDPAAFDGWYSMPSEEAPFTYPPSAWGIMNWWDFGHLISAVGHRIPVSNGMQTGVRESARFFTATDPAAARATLRRTGARYIIADGTLPLSTAERMSSGNGHFRSIVEWTDVPLSKFAELYVAEDSDGVGRVVTVFYPDYYRSMLARLYLFDGQAVEPDHSTWAIRYRPGRMYRQITDLRAFATYREATDYVQAHPLENYVLAGLNPLRSCVPLEELRNIRPVFNSHPGGLGAGPGRIDAVKIFEFQPR